MAQKTLLGCPDRFGEIKRGARSGWAVIAVLRLARMVAKPVDDVPFPVGDMVFWIGRIERCLPIGVIGIGLVAFAEIVECGLGSEEWNSLGKKALLVP